MYAEKDSKLSLSLSPLEPVRDLRDHSDTSQSTLLPRDGAQARFAGRVIIFKNTLPACRQEGMNPLSQLPTKSMVLTVSPWQVATASL